MNKYQEPVSYTLKEKPNIPYWIKVRNIPSGRSWYIAFFTQFEMDKRLRRLAYAKEVKVLENSITEESGIPEYVWR